MRDKEIPKQLVVNMLMRMTKMMMGIIVKEVNVFNVLNNEIK
jgi:hypothetical protein